MDKRFCNHLEGNPFGDVSGMSPVMSLLGGYVFHAIPFEHNTAQSGCPSLTEGEFKKLVDALQKRVGSTIRSKDLSKEVFGAFKTIPKGCLNRAAEEIGCQVVVQSGVNAVMISITKLAA